MADEKPKRLTVSDAAEAPPEAQALLAKIDEIIAGQPAELVLSVLMNALLNVAVEVDVLEQVEEQMRLGIKALNELRGN